MREREICLPAIICRICGTGVALAFERMVLSKYFVKYFRCTGCGSLQTELPYWLDEAYARDKVQFDAGKASRTLFNFLVMPPLLKMLGVRQTDRAVDFGGGSGLFARLMRDAGYEFYSYDKYGNREFADGSTWNQLGPKCYLITMFEVVEHFAEPLNEWGAVFAADPEVIIGSTGLFAGQGEDWSYLIPESGQHVFFYSSEGIALIARRFGRHAYDLGMYFLITREPLSAGLRARIAAWRDSYYSSFDVTLREWMRAPFERAGRDLQDLSRYARLRHANVRIVVDGVYFRIAGGISRVWTNLLAHWSATGLGNFITVIDHSRSAPRYPGITYVDAPSNQRSLIDFNRRQLQDICDRERATLFISTYYTVPVSTPAVLMLYDMIPELIGWDLTEHQWQQKHLAISYARFHIAISRNTAMDLTRFFPHISAPAIAVSHCGTGFRTASNERIQVFKKKYGIERPYFMISGERRSYKNAILFFRAFELLGSRRNAFSIVCTNSNGVLEPELTALAGEATVHHLILPDDELQCAYGGALALVYPSRYEGFGLPVLEAMACSCPVITCPSGSIAEVGGDAVIYVDPDSMDRMHEALQVVQGEAARSSLISRGLERATHFSWVKMGDEVGRIIADKALEATIR